MKFVITIIAITLLFFLFLLITPARKAPEGLVMNCRCQFIRVAGLKPLVCKCPNGQNYRHFTCKEFDSK